MTARFLKHHAQLSEDVPSHSKRFIVLLMELFKDPDHSLALVRDEQQKQALAGLVSKQLRGGIGVFKCEPL